MALDPLFIALDEIPEWSEAAAAGGALLSDSAQADLDAARQASSRVEYARVRRAKQEALALAFARFADREWNQLTTRAVQCASYMSREKWWLDEWALYAAIAESQGLPDWRLWPPPLRDRDPGALNEARRQLAREVLRHQYLQWIADGQWQAARAAARDRGVTIFGDMPFMVSAASPDVWARPDEHMFDVSLGVPPDAFSATGQDWGLPTYRWDRIAATGFAWMRLRARRMAALFDGYRVDHLVGLYRTFGRRSPEDGFFNPDREEQQIAQGERILGILLETGASVVAEDLGVIPDFVRASLDRCEVPGCKVMRWERDWHAPGRPFTDPATYPACSAAMTGTHDTETLAEWWTRADRDERDATLAMLRPYVAATHAFDAATPWSPALRDTLLSAAFASGSRELFVPVQDLFGWTDRINTPGTVGGHNWTWRLPWRVDELDRIPEALERAAFCRALAARHDRSAQLNRT
jgi:4-alpha-glucanotransferase